MDEQKQSLIDRIKQAQNVLVTVSANPSVDQLAAAIGLTVALNKLDKHGTAVFSGDVPSTLDFLKPEDTLEKNTDSLRDFIIALDKSKADKLRYKVEDQVVRIFITPYRTSLSEKDLDFSQGDFNVDVVVALGVAEQQDLDTAITAHGRILHDATVASVSTTGQGSLGTINWVDPSASSLSEMTLGLVDGLDKKLLDNQIATALLTGIVASTDRFRNEHTSPKAMSAAAELMAAGANQQLIASELETPVLPAGDTAAPLAAGDTSPNEQPEPPAEPGTLEIDHDAPKAESGPDSMPQPEPGQPKHQVQVDEDGTLQMVPAEPQFPEISKVRGVDATGIPTESGHEEVQRERLTEPPALGGTELTANTNPESLDPATEELTLPAVGSPILTHNETVLPPPPTLARSPQAEPEATPASMPTDDDLQLPTSITLEPPTPDTTLEQIEQSVHSPHLAGKPAGATPPEAGTMQDALEAARSAVEAAHADPAAYSDPLQPIAALNAQPLGADLRPPTLPSPMPSTGSEAPNPGFDEPTPGTSPADETLDMPLPSNPFGPGQPLPPVPPSSFPGQGTNQNGGTPPPPVPPPMLPPVQ